MASTTQHFDAVVIGAGFSGLHMLKSLRDKLGLKVRVYETGGTVGGTWYWNRYPGARCDSDAYIYCFTWDKQLLQEWQWSERYPEQPEILRYLEEVAKRHDLKRDNRAETPRLGVLSGAGSEPRGNLSAFGFVGCRMRPEGCPGRRISAQIRPHRLASGCDSGGHRLDAEDVEGAAQIVGERRQAELRAHALEAAHQEGALIHPLFDAAERMLDDLAAAVEDLRPRFETLGHAVERGLVFQARDGAPVFVHRERSGQSGQASRLA